MRPPSSPSARAVCEPLETRWLLANTISEIDLATGSSPQKTVIGKDGSVYIYEHGTDKLARMRPGKSTFDEVDIPAETNQHFGMAVSKQGDVYLTVDNGIAAYSPKFNTVTFIDLGADVSDIAPGPDKNLWFTVPADNTLNRLTLVGPKGHPTNEVTSFTVPTAHAGLASLTLGPKKDLWFGEDLVGQVGQATFASGSSTPSITEVALPTGVGAHPLGITPGPDGNIWVCEVFGNKIARVNESTHDVTEFDLPNANSQPFWITSAADKTLWFTEANQGKLGQITTDGTITETDVPAGPSALLTSIVQGKKRTLWFTEADTDKVGKLVLAK